MYIFFKKILFLGIPEVTDAMTEVNGISDLVEKLLSYWLPFKCISNKIKYCEDRSTIFV